MMIYSLHSSVSITSPFSQGNHCTASVDSILKSEDCGLSIKSKGNLLFSAATAQSTMDYSKAPLSDGEVNSPPPKSCIASVTSPSPLRPRRMFASPDNVRGIGCEPFAFGDEDVPTPARRCMVYHSPLFPHTELLVVAHNQVEQS